MSCSYPSCPCGYKSPLCDEYPPKPSQPQPVASSAVEQAKAAIVAKLEQALAELREVNQSMRGIPCPACAEKDQQIVRAEAEITRLRELMTKEMKDKQQGARLAILPVLWGAAALESLQRLPRAERVARPDDEERR